MKIHTFEVTSTYDMLQHNPAGMRSSNANKLDTKLIPSPEDEAAAGRYLTEDGKYFRFPAQAFKSALVSGGTGRRIGKRAATAMLKATIFPAEEWCLLLDPKTHKPLTADKYTIDTRRVVLQKKNGVVRSRPRVGPWCCKVAFEVDEIFANLDLLVEIGNMSGRMIGIGDFRPLCGGPFGRFVVKLI